MADERAYRSGRHPEFCTCVDCEVRSSTRKFASPFRRLLRLLRIGRR